MGNSSLWKKAIPPARDRLQARLLVTTLPEILAVACALQLLRLPVGAFLLATIGICVCFGLLTWLIKAATPAAAVVGGMICFLLIAGIGQPWHSPMRTGLAPLIALFLLTFLATRAGRAWKRDRDPTGTKEGRNAAQVLANLSVAGLVAAGILDFFPSPVELGGGGSLANAVTPALLLAALVETTADTVSSEVGQAFGGAPRLMTTFRKVTAGTDGAISGLGTLSGILGGGAVVLVGMWSMRMSFELGCIAFAGGMAGFVFDSLLGATLERSGWLSNDLVNFFSTIFAVVVAFCLAVFLP